jgi:hypothetical protein
MTLLREIENAASVVAAESDRRRDSDISVFYDAIFDAKLVTWLASKRSSADFNCDIGNEECGESLQQSTASKAAVCLQYRAKCSSNQVTRQT